MTTKFMTGGNTVHVFNLNDETALDKLPAKVYTVAYNQTDGFYLRITKKQLELPTKIYGKAQERVNKCIRTYLDRTASTGILLTGDKGTGKTLLMSLLANQLIEQLHMPVILIKDAYAGSAFVNFVELIGECALVFDEFGKMYQSESRHSKNDSDVPQTALLSLMDGVDKTKRLFIMTENSELDINDFMLNRPSRIYYHFKYHKLDEDSISGYCADHQIGSKIIKEIIDLSRRCRVFSFDMLQTIVEEHIRYGETVGSITSDLNIDTREESGPMIEIIKIVDRGPEIERTVFGSPVVSKPTLRGYTYVKVKPNKDVTKQDLTASDVSENTLRTVNDVSKNTLRTVNDDEFEEIYIQETNLAYEKNGQLVYETEEYTIVAKDIIMPRTNYSALF